MGYSLQKRPLTVNCKPNCKQKNDSLTPYYYARSIAAICLQCSVYYFQRLERVPSPNL